MITVLYFAWVREAVGVDAEEVAVDTPISVGALVDHLHELDGGHALALGNRERLRFAVNQTIVDAEAHVHAGDEVAIFPPVTGG